jgi:hypothetical protein
LLNVGYLFDPRPGPLGPHDLQLHLALMALFAAGLAASVLLSLSRPKQAAIRWLLLAQIPVSSAILVLMAARLFTVPYLSTRALFYETAPLSLAGWAAYLIYEGRRSGFLRQQLTLLTFSWQGQEPSTKPAVAVVLLAVHLLGLMFLAAHTGRPYVWMVGLLLLLMSPQLVLSLWKRRGIIHLEALSPLWFAYLAALARRVCAKLLTQPLPLYDGFAYPEPFSSLLNVEAVLLAAIVYVILCQGYLLALRSGRRDRLTRYVGVTLAIVVMLWAGVTYFRHRTHGVTASDPYAYAQMAVDIAEHGNPTHLFPLFPRASNLGISWWPLVHYGYQVRVPPLQGDGRTASDWPPGWPAILAIGYLLLGEQGLYLVNPLVGLLCLAALIWLVAELLYDRSWEERLLAGALAAFCLSTSYEFIDRLVVPMADASAQLFTTLTILFLLRAMRGRPRLHAALAGVCLGVAYLIRHTQLVLCLCAAVSLIYLARNKLGGRKLLQFVGLFGLTALLLAIPDLLYHQFVFGHFLRLESTELELFSLSHVPATARLLWQRMMAGNEFGYLSPLIAYGAYRMYAVKRGQFFVLLAAMLGVLAVHLPYEALRLRDVLSLFPVLLAWAGYGVGDLWRRIPVGRGYVTARSHALGVSVLLALLLLPLLRTWPILSRPWGDYRASFGYVTEEERRGFDALAAATVEPCVVGSSLNGGPVDLYAGRQAFRPAFWTTQELDIFLEEMFRQGTNVYLLDDGEALQGTLEHVKAHYRVTARAQLTVPLFGDPQHISSELYQIEPLTGTAP